MYQYVTPCNHNKISNSFHMSTFPQNRRCLNTYDSKVKSRSRKTRQIIHVILCFCTVCIFKSDLDTSDMGRLFWVCNLHSIANMYCAVFVPISRIANYSDVYVTQARKLLTSRNFVMYRKNSTTTCSIYSSVYAQMFICQ